jgi:hypothetical protein
MGAAPIYDTVIPEKFIVFGQGAWVLFNAGIILLLFAIDVHFD